MKKRKKLWPRILGLLEKFLPKPHLATAPEASTGGPRLACESIMDRTRHDAP